MPVTMLARPSVIITGASTAADGSVAVIRSTSEEASIPVIAAVEVSGPATANRSELPSAITVARAADEMKVAAMP